MKREVQIDPMNYDEGLSITLQLQLRPLLKIGTAAGCRSIFSFCYGSSTFSIENKNSLVKLITRNLKVIFLGSSAHGLVNPVSI